MDIRFISSITWELVRIVTGRLLKTMTKGNCVKRLIVALTFTLIGCGTDGSNAPPTDAVSIGQIYWSDGDSGRLDGVPFRLRDVDAPETGGVGAAIGGAKCERERERGFESKEFIVTLTANATVAITNNYGPDRFDRDVVDLNADGIDVAAAGIEAGHLKPWPHDSNGNSLSAKPVWCD